MFYSTELTLVAGCWCQSELLLVRVAAAAAVAEAEARRWCGGGLTATAAAAAGAGWCTEALLLTTITRSNEYSNPWAVGHNISPGPPASLSCRREQGRRGGGAWYQEQG